MSLLDDYATMHRLIVQTESMDTEATVLAEVSNLLHLDKNQAAWMCFVYLAYYDMGSFLRCFEFTRNPEIPADKYLRLSCDTERRVHRVPAKMERHFGDVVSIADSNGGLYNWLSSYVEKSPQQSWVNMINPVETIFGNGRWASYRTIEMIGQVCGLPVEAPDMGHANSSGPRRGLEFLYSDLPQGNKPADIAYLDQVSLDLNRKLAERGISAKLQDTETGLCGFKSMVKGDYYVGEDLDSMLEEILKQPSGLTQTIFEARKNIFPHEYLGELNGWTGMDRARKKIYKETGQIVTR